MITTIFEYKSYKAYLNDILVFRASGSRGERSKMASAINCHTAYVSQVLNGDAHFSLEQGELINKFLGHTSEQSHFFLLLVQAARAGSPSLKKYFEEQMNHLIEKQFSLKDRLKIKKVLSSEDQARFYSSWHYGAIHVLVSVPGCHTAQGISEYLGLPLQKVNDVLEFLTSVGLISRKNEKYEIATSHIHIGTDSYLISKHHTNWRLQAINALDSSNSANLNYSSVITCSKDDSKKIREILIQAIEEIRSVVKPSKDEAAFCYNLDFFSLKNKV